MIRWLRRWLRRRPPAGPRVRTVLESSYHLPVIVSNGGLATREP